MTAPPPFDPDDWRRRYHAAHRRSYEELAAMDGDRRDALLAIGPDTRTPAEAEEFARLQEQYAALLAPREALLQEWVQAHPGRTYHPARDPNTPPFFPPEMTASLWFVRCKDKVACARCGKARKRHWTMVVPFKAAEFAQYTLDHGPEVYYPLTPVCDDHPLLLAPLPAVTPG